MKTKVNEIPLVGPKGRKELIESINSLKEKIKELSSSMVQADFNQEDSTKIDYIKNKPAPTTADDILDLLAQKEYFTIEALNDSTTVKFIAETDEDDDTHPKTVQVSTDKVTWESKTSTEEQTLLATLNAGEKLYIKGNNRSYSFDDGDDGISSNCFIVDKDVYVYGNIMTLVTGDDALEGIDAQLEEYAFAYFFSRMRNYLLFRSDKKLALPSNMLDYGCYEGMLSFCTRITSAPVLPAKNLATNCYKDMFEKCTALKRAPELPATELAYGCYESMFAQCTGIAVAPKLPATVLKGRCYADMFNSCTNLTTVPELPATTLDSKCYFGMFENCTGITQVPANLLPAIEVVENCYNTMFSHCTSLTNAPELPATNAPSNCYGYMFWGCTALTSTPSVLKAEIVEPGAYASMFNGCINITSSPDILAKKFDNLWDGCATNMFNGCSSLSRIKCLVTEDVFVEYGATGTFGWTEGVAEHGVFIKHPNATFWTEGAGGIPEGWTVETATN